jgi:hypothetical protein
MNRVPNSFTLMPMRYNALQGDAQRKKSLEQRQFAKTGPRQYVVRSPLGVVPEFDYPLV